MKDWGSALIAGAVAILVHFLSRWWTARDKTTGDSATVKVATISSDTEFRAQLWRRIGEVEGEVRQLRTALDEEQERHHECERRCTQMESEMKGMRLEMDRIHKR